jgi:chorismate synthase
MKKSQKKLTVRPNGIGLTYKQLKNKIAKDEFGVGAHKGVFHGNGLYGLTLLTPLNTTKEKK